MPREKKNLEPTLSTRACVRAPQIATGNALQKYIADERYRAADGAITAVPRSESLQDTCARVTDIWESDIAPALREGKRVLVVSHGNTLRALVKLIDGVSEKDSFHLDLPTAWYVPRR